MFCRSNFMTYLLTLFAPSKDMVCLQMIQWNVFIQVVKLPFIIHYHVIGCISFSCLRYTRNIFSVLVYARSIEVNFCFLSKQSSISAINNYKKKRMNLTHEKQNLIAIDLKNSQPFFGSAKLSVFTPLIHKPPSSFQLSVIDMKSTINKLVPNMAHGHDVI